MHNFEDHVDKMVQDYSQGVYFDEVQKAQELYAERTGLIDRDSDEYESRMRSFYDWYIFQHKLEDGSTILHQYLTTYEIDQDVAKAFHNSNFSLFHFQKIGFGNKVILRDILHDRKIVLSKNNEVMAIVEHDLFVGRTISHNKQTFLLPGICVLPQDVLPLLKKESKKIRKLNNERLEEDFLIHLMSLKTKSIHYSHLRPTEVFSFSS